MNVLMIFTFALFSSIQGTKHSKNRNVAERSRVVDNKLDPFKEEFFFRRQIIILLLPQYNQMMSPYGGTGGYGVSGGYGGYGGFGGLGLGYPRMPGPFGQSGYAYSPEGGSQQNFGSGRRQRNSQMNYETSMLSHGDVGLKSKQRKPFKIIS